MPDADAQSSRLVGIGENIAVGCDRDRCDHGRTKAVSSRKPSTGAIVAVIPRKFSLSGGFDSIQLWEADVEQDQILWQFLLLLFCG